MAVIAFDGYDPADEPRREALFALGNGVLHTRAAAPEGAADGRGYPGTYLAGVYDRQESLVAGRRVANTSLVNLPNWLPLSFRTAGEDWFRLDPDKLLSYRQALDLETAILTREMLIVHGGRRTRLRERRLVDMSRPDCARLEWELTPCDWAGRLEIRSGLDGRVENRNVRKHLAYESRHLEPLAGEASEPGLLRLAVRTRQSSRRVTVTALTELEGVPVLSRDPRLEPGWAAEHIACEAAEGQPLRIRKTAIFTVEGEHGRGQDQRPASRAADIPRGAAGETLEAGHAAAWRRLWSRTQIQAEDHLAVQLRFHVFRLLQTLSPHTAQVDAGFPARGLEEFYNGQVFWDDTFAFPYLALHFPEVARGLLLYRWRRLDAARRAAAGAGLCGAMFPWRSATTGEEETPALQHNGLPDRWVEDHTYLQRHIGSAIALNVWRYHAATGDMDFLAGHGAELLLEIARFWAALARPAQDGRYDICGVVGPDEFHTRHPGSPAPGIDNNAYTNVLAAWTLARAEDVLGLLPPGRRAALLERLGLDATERTRWAEVSRGLRLPFAPDGALLPFQGFDRLEPLDTEALGREQPGMRTDWALDALGDDVNRYQVLKQPDTLTLLYLFTPAGLQEIVARMGYDLSPEQIRLTAERQLAWTSHESSLSEIVCAGALTRIDPGRSWTLFRQGLGVDLDPGDSSGTEEGPHLGAMAASLDVLQRCYLGLRAGDPISLRPAPPPGLCPIAFEAEVRGARLRLTWADGELEVRADGANGAPVRLATDEGELRLAPGEAWTWRGREP